MTRRLAGCVFQMNLQRSHANRGFRVVTTAVTPNMFRKTAKIS